MGIENVKWTAFMGVDAIKISGSTIHAFFGIDIGTTDKNCNIQPLTNDKLVALRIWLDINFNNYMLICILDEITMVTPKLLAIIYSRLRQATNVHHIFGGIRVVVFGGFSQLHPVKVASITDVVIKKARN